MKEKIRVRGASNGASSIDRLAQLNPVKGSRAAWTVARVGARLDGVLTTTKKNSRTDGRLASTNQQILCDVVLRVSPPIKWNIERTKTYANGNAKFESFFSNIWL